MASSMMEGSGSSECFEEQEWYGIAIGVFITIGICVSFVPQHYAFIKNKSSEGVSTFTVLISNVAAYTIFLVGVLTNWDQILCCRTLEFWQIHITLLSLYTLFVPVINYLIIFALLIAYHKPSEDRPREGLIMKVSLLAYGVIVVVTTIIAIALLWIVGPDDKIIKSYVLGLTVITVGSTLVQWLPQIWTTFKCKTGGELSMMMLLIQAPGTALIAIFQGIIYDQGIAVWGPYLITTLQMSVLIALIVYYDHIINRKTKEVQDNLDGFDEVAPLVQADDKLESVVMYKDEGDEARIVAEGSL